MRSRFEAIIYNIKPDRLFRPARLFYCLLLPILLWSCSSTRKSTGTAAPDDLSYELRLPKDSAIQTEVAEAIFMEAVKARILGKTKESFNYYSLLASTGNLGATPHYELSRLWLDSNNVPRALSEIKKATQKDSTNKWFQTQLADLLAYDGQYIKAAEVYSRLAANDRHPEEFLMRQAMLYQKAGMHLEALAVMDTLGKFLGEDDESLLLQRQQAYLQLNDVDGAAKSVRQLIRYYPHEPRYAILLADIYENNNRPDEARIAFEQAISLFPEDASVQFAMVQYYLSKKDTAKLHQYLEMAILNREVPIEDRLGLLAPFIRLSGGEAQGKRLAFDIAKKLSYQEPLQPEAIMLYADMLMGDDRIAESLHELKRSIAADSTRYQPWQQIMFLYATTPVYDSLIAYSERAAAIFPRESLIYYFGGVGYLQKRRFDEAAAYLHKAMDTPRNYSNNVLADILVTLGDTYNSMSRHTASDSCYEEALLLQPDNATALNNYSYYLSLRGEKLDQAEKMSAKSLKLRPGEATFLDTYGWILFQLGKYAEAKQYLQEAVNNSRDASDATLWEHLGDAELKLGNKAKAREHWHTALKNGGDSETILKKLNELNENEEQ
jgi:Tfp pilus assembly protein PilF